MQFIFMTVEMGVIMNPFQSHLHLHYRPVVQLYTHRINCSINKMWCKQQDFYKRLNDSECFLKKKPV